MQALFWWHMEKRRTENGERSPFPAGFVLRSPFLLCRLPLPPFAYSLICPNFARRYLVR